MTGACIEEVISLEPLLEGRLRAAGTQLPMIAGSTAAMLPPESTAGLPISILIAGKRLA